MIRGVLFLWCFILGAFSAEHHFSLVKKESHNGETLFIIGGIHGNEPGGYFAPALLSMHYTVTKGNVWIVPGLNLDSIIMNQRGIYKDMNRKFADIDLKDPDYTIVEDIKKLIIHPQIGLILNLHDGHGFYRSEYKNETFNPKAWGQAFIIDQSAIKGVKFGNLEDLARQVNNKDKIVLADDEHDFGVKNTLTSEQNKEMQKSLTYFAITRGKPALAIETSKNIKETALKVFYQLQTIERFMNLMGIEYQRDFELTLDNVKYLLEKERGIVTSCDGRVRYILDNIASEITPLAICQDIVSKNPLIVYDNKQKGIYYGNLKLASTSLDKYERGDEITIHLSIDGMPMNVKLGDLVEVNDFFSVDSQTPERVNIIGFTKEGISHEVGLSVRLNDMVKKYALDKEQKIYRVEFYERKKLRGNILIRFK